MCLIGGNHKHSLNCKLFTSEMTRKQLIELIAKKGYIVDVSEEEGSGYVRVISDEALPNHVKEIVNASVPPGIKLNFVVRGKGVQPLPKGLEDWYKGVKRYMKK